MSSFVKIKKDDTIEIKGVRTSIRNGQITSTGSDSFDFVIGGGLEVSSCLLIGKKIFNYEFSSLVKGELLGNCWFNLFYIFFKAKTNTEDMQTSSQDFSSPTDFIINTKFTSQILMTIRESW